MEDYLKEIGQRVKAARENNKMSQMELASITHLTASHISNIENGKINMGVESLIRLVKALKVSSDWLIQNDTLAVKEAYGQELQDLLTGRTPTECKAVLEVASQMLKAMDKAKNSES